MAKWIKVVLAVVIAVPVVAAVALATLVEPNDYKPEIEKLVSDSTGREFSINGDIGLSLFPWLGFEAEGISLANHQSFSDKPMLAIESASASLKLLPLLSGTLQIATVEVNGLAATVGIKRNGEPSWADLIGEASEPEAETTAADPAPSGLPDFSLAKLALNNAAIHWLDKAAASTTVIEPLNLAIGQAKNGQAFPLNADLRLRQTVDGASTAIDLDLVTQVLLDSDSNLASLQNMVLEIDSEIAGLKPISGEIKANIEALLDGSQVKLSGLNGELNGMTLNGQLSASRLTTKPLVDATLALGKLDVDDFLASLPAAAEAPTQTAEQRKEARHALNATPVDLSALHSVDAKLKLTADALVASGMQASNAIINAQINNGVLSLSTLSAALYDGVFDASANVNANSKKIQWQHQLSGVQAEPLQNDVMGDAYISGEAAMETSLTMVGSTVGQLRKSLNGQGNLAFKDGALKGINVAGVLRKAFAQYKGEPIPEDDTEVLDTDFSSATASFTIVNGVFNNPDMLVESPLIRITGAGEVNLVTEALNYRVKPVIVASLEGQGGRSLEELDGLPIPVKCRGELQAPDCKTDFSGLLEDKAKAELEKEKQKAEEKAREKLEEKAKDLLNKWR